MSACPRLGKLFGGCRFVARYDKQDTEYRWVPIPGSPYVQSVAVRPQYLGDICTRCGEWRARPEGGSK